LVFCRVNQSAPNTPTTNVSCDCSSSTWTAACMVGEHGSHSGFATWTDLTPGRQRRYLAIWSARIWLLSMVAPVGWLSRYLAHERRNSLRCSGIEAHHIHHSGIVWISDAESAGSHADNNQLCRNAGLIPVLL